MDSLTNAAIKYLDIGQKQFSDEWRCYWAAAFVYDIVGEKQKALEVLDRGLANVPEYDEGGRARLTMSKEQIKMSPEKPMVVEEPAADTAKPDSAQPDSNPVVAAAN